MAAENSASSGDPSAPETATPWVLLRHDLPNGSWHYDWMLASPGATGEARLITFRVAQRPDDPGTVMFDAQRVGAHRREYLEYQGSVSGGRGKVRREATGLCRVRRDDAVFVVELIEAVVTWIGTPTEFESHRYRFERHEGTTS